MKDLFNGFNQDTFHTVVVIVLVTLLSLVLYTTYRVERLDDAYSEISERITMDADDAESDSESTVEAGAAPCIPPYCTAGRVEKDEDVDWERASGNVFISDILDELPDTYEWYDAYVEPVFTGESSRATVTIQRPDCFRRIGEIGEARSLITCTQATLWVEQNQAATIRELADQDGLFSAFASLPEKNVEVSEHRGYPIAFMDGWYQCRGTGGETCIRKRFLVRTSNTEYVIGEISRWDHLTDVSDMIQSPYRFEDLSFYEDLFGLVSKACPKPFMGEEFSVYKFGSLNTGAKLKAYATEHGPKDATPVSSIQSNDLDLMAVESRSCTGGFFDATHIQLIEYDREDETYEYSLVATLPTPKANAGFVYTMEGWLPDNETVLMSALMYDGFAGVSCTSGWWASVNVKTKEVTYWRTPNFMRVKSYDNNTKLVFDDSNACINPPTKIQVIDTKTGSVIYTKPIDVENYIDFGSVSEQDEGDGFVLNYVDPQSGETGQIDLP